MFWEIGERVLCINDDFSSFKETDPFLAGQIQIWPASLSIYTLKYISSDTRGAQFKEIKNPKVFAQKEDELEVELDWPLFGFVSLQGAPFDKNSIQSKLLRAPSIKFLYKRIMEHIHSDQAWVNASMTFDLVLQALKKSKQTKALAEKLEKHHEKHIRNKNNAFSTKLAVAQSQLGQTLIIGQGFIGKEAQAKPFRIIDDVPVYHVAENKYPFPERPFTQSCKKIDSYYDDALLVGMPNVGGTVNFYIDKRQRGWLSLWSRTKLDSYAFGPSPLSEPERIAWTPIILGEQVESALSRLYRAYFIQTNYIDGLFDETNFNTISGLSVLSFSQGCVLKTIHRSEKTFQTNLKECPEYLKVAFKQQAEIDPWASGEMAFYESSKLKLEAIKLISKTHGIFGVVKENTFELYTKFDDPSSKITFQTKSRESELLPYLIMHLQLKLPIEETEDILKKLSGRFRRDYFKEYTVEKILNENSFIFSETDYPIDDSHLLTCSKNKGYDVKAIIRLVEKAQTLNFTTKSQQDKFDILGRRIIQQVELKSKLDILLNGKIFEHSINRLPQILESIIKEFSEKVGPVDLKELLNEAIELTQWYNENINGLNKLPNCKLLIKDKKKKVLKELDLFFIKDKKEQFLFFKHKRKLKNTEAVLFDLQKGSEFRYYITPLFKYEKINLLYKTLLSTFKIVNRFEDFNASQLIFNYGNIESLNVPTRQLIFEKATMNNIGEIEYQRLDA